MSTEKRLDAWLHTELDVLHDELDNVLDVEAGLHAILQVPGCGLLAYAEDFAGLPAAQRLLARTWFPMELLASLEPAAHARLKGHALTRELVLSPALPGDVVSLAQAQCLALGHLLLALEPADDEAPALAFSLAGALGRDHDRVRALAQALDQALVVARTRDLQRVRALVPDELARALDQTGGGDDDLLHAIDLLDRALVDAVDGDLRDVDLTGVPLVGVRWSSATRWPVRWEDRVAADSAQIEADLYEIRGRASGVNSLVRA